MLYRSEFVSVLREKGASEAFIVRTRRVAGMLRQVGLALDDFGTIDQEIDTLASAAALLGDDGKAFGRVASAAREFVAATHALRDLEDEGGPT